MIDPQIFYSRFAALCKTKSQSVSATLKILNISIASSTAWKKGDYAPSADVINRIANHFNVSTDYLLGRTNDLQPCVFIDELDADATPCGTLKKLIDTLTDEQIAQVRGYIDALKQVN